MFIDCRHMYISGVFFFNWWNLSWVAFPSLKAFIIRVSIPILMVTREGFGGWRVLQLFGPFGLPAMQQSLRRNFVPLMQ